MSIDPPVRICVGCRRYDDAPRDVLSRQGPWHMDCHAAQGCPTCTETLAATSGLRDDDLRSWLTAQREARTDG